jgi:hypothetical protein
VSLAVAVLIVLGAAALVGLVFLFLDRVLTKPLVPEAARGGPTLIVAGTMFAVLLAFVILAAFQAYNGAKAGAASEADAVLDMTRTAALFPLASATGCGLIWCVTDVRSFTRSGPR